MSTTREHSPDIELTPPDQESSWTAYFEELSIRSSVPLLQNFYAAGTVTNETPISNTPFVAMDFETTGLDPDNDEIVSIGVVPFSLQRVFCRESRHWLVKPQRELAENSIVIHGITHSDLSEAPDLEKVLEDVLTVLAGKVAVVHYQHIERNFMARALKDRLGEGIIFPLIDTMELEQRIQVQERNMMARLMQKPMPSLRLGDCRGRYNLPHYHAHHALTDALATAELLQAQICHYFSPDTPIAELWL